MALQTGVPREENGEWGTSERTSGEGDEHTTDGGNFRDFLICGLRDGHFPGAGCDGGEPGTVCDGVWDAGGLRQGSIVHALVI